MILWTQSWLKTSPSSLPITAWVSLISRPSHVTWVHTEGRNAFKKSLCIRLSWLWERPDFWKNWWTRDICPSHHHQTRQHPLLNHLLFNKNDNNRDYVNKNWLKKKYNSPSPFSLCNQFLSFFSSTRLFQNINHKERGKTEKKKKENNVEKRLSKSGQWDFSWRWWR